MRIRTIAVSGMAATGIAATLAAGAFAADLPRREAPYAPAPSYLAPAPMWSGFYVGIQAGWMWGNDGAREVDRFWSGANDFARNRADYTLRALPGNQSFDSTGATGGVTLGWNHQMGSAVLGVEADLSIAGVDGSKRTGGTYAYNLPAAQPPVTTNYPVRTTSASSMDWFATLRARAGFLVTPATLIYATGGAAFGDPSASLTIEGAYYTVATGQTPWVSKASGGDTKVGWTIGGGVEHKFSRNWSLKLEYLYYDLGEVTVKNDMSAALVGGAVASVDQIAAWKTNKFDFSGSIFRGGVNYQF